MSTHTDGFQPVRITQKLMDFMVRKYGRPVPLHVRVSLVPGPCTDDWCRMLQKPVAGFVTEDSLPDGSICVSLPGKTDVYVDRSFHEVSRRNREVIVLDTGLHGKIKVRLLTSNQESRKHR